MPLMHRDAVTLVSAAAAFVALLLSLRHVRRNRLLADTTAVRIRSAAQGYVKVSGRAVPAHFEPTRAPLTGRPCVWWSYQIEYDQSDKPGRSDWRTCEQASSVELFMLVDEDDSRCLVGPVQAEITPQLVNVWYGEQARPSGIAAFDSPIRIGDYRYTERLIEPGTHLSVVGELRSHSEVGDVDRLTQEKLRAWKQDQALLLSRFDKNHDGRIDQSEWDQARAAAAAEAQSQVLSQHVERVSVIAAPATGQPFLIAPLTGAQLVQRERWMALLWFALGVAALAVCGWALKQGAG